MKYIKVNNCIVKDNLVKFHIDSPNSNRTYSNIFLFSGWAFSINKNENVTILIEYSNKIVKEPLSVVRNDVVAHFTKNSNSLEPPLKCGFTLSLTKDAKVTICCNDTPTIEFTFSIIDSEIKSEWELLEKLNQAHVDNNPELIDEKALVLLDNSPYNYVGSNPSDLNDAYWIPNEIKENLIYFIKNARSFDFGPKIIKSALENGVIKIASPLNAKKDAYCDSSFYSAPFNYLRFISEGIAFYIIQHFSFCDVIYIPKFGVRHFLSPWINKNKWHENVARRSLKANKKKGGFNSVFAAHNRPYHYNYDIALGLHLLDRNNLLDQIPLLALHEEKCYFRPSRLINSRINESVFNNTDFITHLNQPGFSILAGHQTINTAKEITYCELFAELDSKLRDNSETLLDSNIARTICNNLDECSIKLWFGITSQKRKLLNQEEEIAKTINIFAELFDNVGVVIDGWTSPLKKSEEDLKQIESDSVLASTIKNLIDADNISFHSVIGLTTEEKVVIAKHIDVFLANHGAGSMHIDRIGKIFGVTHNSSIWSAADFAHIHNNSIKISQIYISDFEAEDKAQDYVDYSVTPKIIAKEMLKQYFNSVNKNRI